MYPACPSLCTAGSPFVSDERERKGSPIGRLAAEEILPFLEVKDGVSRSGEEELDRVRSECAVG